jgi:GNAT superfamily N-acetyltransferase
MDVTIRAATVDDVPSLDVLRRQAIDAAFRDEYAQSVVTDLTASPDDALRSRVESDRYDVRLAETEVTVVSYGILDLTACRLEGLFTNPAYQREGFGSLLLDRLTDAADCERLTARVPEPAVAFFEAAGFQTTGEAEWQGLPAQRMAMEP